MRGRAVILALGFVVAHAVLPAPASAAGHATDPLPRYPQLEPNVAFWRDVFAKYTKQQVVFHDPYFLDLVYAVADVSEIIRGDGSDPASQRALRSYTASESARIGAALRRLAYAQPETEDERYLSTLLAAHAGVLPSNAELAERIRTQRGLGDDLCGTIARARPWLPEMKQILAANGVPIELANLPLVESGYRVGAHSFVGAAGMWQFTRGTGRRYLRIDHVLDERRDPLAATEAAARYLRANYERLGSWPLAITAYNHGEGGIATAVRQLGTTDLGEIVTSYRGRAFGFASRNFYAEFLAARDVMQNADKYCPETGLGSERLERVHIDNYVPISHLARCAGLDAGTLAEINPALQRDVAQGRLHVPRGYRLWVPADSRESFETAYAALPREAFHVAQKSTSTVHRVRSGQTLSQIAKSYGVSVSTLQRTNGIRDSRRLRVGQSLRIPGKSSPVAVASAAPSRSTASTPAKSASTTYVVHKLARGQTLSHVAKRYGVSVASIQSVNGIRNPRSLRAGQQLKIPRGGRAVAAAYRTHKVGRGQTLSQIAALYRTTVSAIQKVNGISDPESLRSGQVIRIPM